MSIPALPGADLVPSVTSRIVTIDAVTMTEGSPVTGDQAWIDFILPVDLNVKTDGKIIAASRVRVPLVEGKGKVRLPCYDPDALTVAGDRDWGIIVRKGWGGDVPHTWCGSTRDGAYLIRVPEGKANISLAALPAVRPLRGRERQYAITGVSVVATEGDAVTGEATLDGGVLRLDLTIPRGKQGIPGPGAVATDDAVATYIGTDSKISTALNRVYRRGYSPREFGVVGDGKVDDTAAWNQGLAGLPAGATVVCPEGDKYKLTGPVNLAKPVTIEGGEFLPHTTGRGLYITSSDVTLTGVRCTSESASDPTESHQIIAVRGSSGAPVERVVLDRCVVDKTRYHGIVVEWGRDIKITGCTVTDFQYSGILLISVTGGEVSGCTIRNGLQQGNITNTYGISVTDLSNSFRARSKDVLVTRNIVDNIPRWEGIDTHGGERITITDNIVTRCHDGIAAVGGSDKRVTAPKSVVISGNTIDATGIDGPRSAIRFYGIDGDGEKASGVIGPNTIIGGYVMDVEAKHYDASTVIQAQATSIASGYSSHPAPFRMWAAAATIKRTGDNVTTTVNLPKGVFTAAPLVFLTPQNGGAPANGWTWSVSAASKESITINGKAEKSGSIDIKMGVLCIQMSAATGGGVPRN